MEDGCAPRRMHLRTVTRRCALRSSSARAAKGIREGRAPQSFLRGFARGGEQQGVAGRLETKAVSMNSAAASGRMANIMARRRAGGDQWQGSSRGIRNERVAERGEKALAAMSGSGSHRAPS